jgi:glucuronate isomerase
MCRTLDNLAEFEEFAEKILPAIRRDLTSGMTETQILEKYKALAAASVATLTTKLDTPAVALAAARDILDRTGGKAVERRQVEHRLGKLPEKELDAVIYTELEKLGAITDAEEDSEESDSET